MSNSGLYFFKNTLEYHRSRPFMSCFDMSKVRLQDLAVPLEGYMNNTLTDVYSKHMESHGKMAVPEVDAIEFYVRNHGMARIAQTFAQQERLPDEVNRFVDDYVSVSQAKSIRAFYYLMLIISKEARHGTPKNVVVLEKKFGCDVKNKIVGGSSNWLSKLLDKASNITLVDYCNAIEWQFTEFTYGGSFGGKPWANVANCAKKFVTGEYSAEVMLDTVWTLAHNNGPIFNKGILYSGYSSKSLRMVLDLQRAGQLPNAVYNKEFKNLGYISEDLNKSLDWMVSIFPELAEPVDWVAVMEAGAVGAYHNKIPKAVAEGKVTPDQKIKGATGISDQSKKMFFVMPDLSVHVTKIDRKKKSNV